MKKIEDLKIKIFSDGHNQKDMFDMNNKPFVKGLTTNPSLMKKAGIKDYKSFAKDVLAIIKEKPISFEVFSDEFDEMKRQALDIASWSENIYVKIPITNTKAESSVELINSLSEDGVKINVTAMMTVEQVKSVLPGLSKGPGGYVSVFAGRIADAGQDPLPVMKETVEILKDYSHIELIWASPRELFNVVQADSIGCHIITATNNILKKLPTLGKDLDRFSLETVQMFYDDATEAGYTL